MTRKYSDRSMSAEPKEEGTLFFFPKNNPPVSIRAATREQAEQKLLELNTKEA